MQAATEVARGNVGFHFFASGAPVVLFIDNYDSFVHNLARYFRLLGQETDVVRNDAISVDDVAERQPEAIVLSPGPCAPKQAGISLEVVRRFSGEIPILGICLGHQAIVEAMGGEVIRAERPVHGQTSLVRHDGKSLFAGIESPLVACRYHSLVTSRATLPDCLEVIAWTDENEIMAVEHREDPMVGIQFHPEAILTRYGEALLSGFLLKSGLVGEREHLETSTRCREKSRELSES